MASTDPQEPLPGRARGKRKRRGGLNKNLFPRNGVWWLRISLNGDDVRESLGVPVSEVVAARRIREARIAKLREQRAGVGDGIPEALSVGELVKMYLEAECRPYDRERGGEQPGSKRDPASDRSAAKRLFRHFSPNISAGALSTEALVDLADKMERETPTPAKATRKKSMAFLRHVLNWAAARKTKTGVTKSPFSEQQTKALAKKLLPKGDRRGYIYSPEQLRQLYGTVPSPLVIGLLPSHSARVSRFAVHAGMREREIFTLRCGRVDLEGRKLTVLAQYAKNGREREVALGDVALEILKSILPENPDPDAYVFLGPKGRPLKSISTGFVAAIKKIWKPSKPGERRPRFHDLRKTAATRVEAVSSHGVAKKFLGHVAEEDVTDSYILPSLEDVRNAINRAARSIDGEPPAGAILFPLRGPDAGTAHQTAQQPESGSASAR